MSEVELSAGIIEYEDTGGDGPAVVPLHGFAMDGSLWRHVVAELRDDHRCVVPTLPLGSHRRPMRADADLSMRGLAGLVAEFLERLDLSDVTLVGNDSGLAQVVVAERPERVGRLVLSSQEAFDNIPPGLPGRFSTLAGRMPGGLYLAAQTLRLRPMQRMPFTWGWMAKRPIPPEVVDGWMRPARAQSGVRRDVRRFVRAIDRRELIEATQKLRSFERPALVAWAAEDRIMPPEHGRRLAELLPQGQLVEIADSYTFIPEDQPGELARAIREFVRDTAAERESGLG